MIRVLPHPPDWPGWGAGFSGRAIFRRTGVILGKGAPLSRRVDPANHHRLALGMDILAMG